MAVKATLGDVHLMLMEQMQRLSECEPGSDEMDSEVTRSDSLSGLAKAVVANASLMVRAASLAQRSQVPQILIGDGSGNDGD